MSGVEATDWGNDRWLTDRKARRSWLRFIGLHRLTEQILRTPSGPGDAISCLLDEVFADRTPLSRAKVARCVSDDISRFRAWLRKGVKQGSLVAPDFETVAVILPDGAPYELQLALVSAPPNEGKWAASIAWRASRGTELELLAELLPLTKRLGAAVRRDADYIVPLAHAAFLLRDVVRNARPNKLRGAIVSYAGGDGILVPLE